MQKLVTRNVRELDEPRSIRIQSSLWWFGRIGRVILVCLPPVALLGVFAGRGPLSEQSLRSAGASGEIAVTYERFLHRENETTLIVDVRPPQPGDTILRVSGNIIVETGEFEITPAPLDVFPGLTVLEYRIHAAAEGARVTARYRPQGWGVITARIEVVCATCPGPAPAVELRQFVYP